jgi:hypothetical protein
MVAGGIDQDRIAAAFRITPKTLRRHCRDELTPNPQIAMRHYPAKSQWFLEPST